MKRRIFLGVTAVLILLLAGSVTGTALCRPKQSVEVGEAQYGPMEEAYVEEVKELLEEAGLSSAGVMLTYVRDSDGGRTYTLSVHHRGFAYLGQEEQEYLARAMEDCFFKQEHCSVVQELTCRADH